MESPPIAISSIVVRRGRLTCEIEVPDARFRYTNPQIAQRALEAYPSLSRHACVNAEGRTFDCVIEHTSIAHLLEHLAVELQTRAVDNPQAVFVGTSEWLDEASGKACVQLSFCDDLEALRALKEAAQIINGLLVSPSTPIFED
ncbi:MAG: hypothetical protein IJI68_11295 [Eggerthellaceae bacterium]|jgi:hypothetical protein|nr:hypothetical protein [Eggerthellaceae bacterium]